MPPKIFDRKEKMNILKIPHRNLDLLRLKIVILLPIYTFPPLYAERPAERRVFLHLKMLIIIIMGKIVQILKKKVKAWQKLIKTRGHDFTFLQKMQAHIWQLEHGCAPRGRH